MKKILMLLLVSLFIVAPAMAVLNDADIYYSMDDSNVSGSFILDSSGNDRGGTITGATTGVTGKINEAFSFDGSGDHIETNSSFDSSDSDFTVGGWFKFDSFSADAVLTEKSSLPVSASTLAWGFQIGGTGTQPLCYQRDSGGTNHQAIYTHNMSAGTYYFLVCRYNNTGNKIEIFENNVIKNTNTDTYTPKTSISDTLYLGERRDGYGDFAGDMDEWFFYDRLLTDDEITELYNAGAGKNPYYEPNPDAPNERVPQTGFITQSSNVTINSGAYTTVFSGNYELIQSGTIYVDSNIPIKEITATNTAECRINVDGSFYDSTVTRSNTAGNNGLLRSSTSNISLSAGNYTVALECRRNSGSGSYTVSQGNIVVHDMTSSSGDPLTYKYQNITSLNIASLPFTTTFTTSENQTSSGEQRYLEIEYEVSYSYSATGNISTTVELAGTNCTPAIRYGTSGSTGSIGGSCLVAGVINDTTYDIKIYGSGTGSITNGRYHIKELIADDLEANITTLQGLTTNTSFQKIAEINITSVDHSSYNLFTKAGVSVQSDNTNTTAEFYTKFNGQTSPTITRGLSGARQPGVLVVEEIYSTTNSTPRVELWGRCTTDNCTINGVDLVAYITDTSPLTTNSFNITAYNLYDNSSINQFNIKDSQDNTFSTSDGTINIFTTNSTFDVYFPGNNNTEIKFFSNNTLAHNTSNNLNISARPWTRIYVYEPDLTLIQNFSVNWSSDGGVTGNVTVTDGSAYVPIYNDTFTLTVYDAVGETGVEYAINEQTFTEVAYLRNATFDMQVTNSINIQFFDEETGLQINNVTLEYYSTSGDSGNASTNNSLIFLSLLVPDTYTFVYDADGYLQRFYEFTLVDDTFNELNLTLLNGTTGQTVTLTLKDTLNNFVEGAIIKLQKFNPVDNDYDLLEVRETNFEGQTVFNVVLNSAQYRFLVEVDGSVVLTTEKTQIYGTTLTLIVDLTDSTGYEEIFGTYTISGAISYDNATRTATYSWNDESNTATQACLTVYDLTTNNKAQTNQTCSASPSGSTTFLLDNSTGSAWQLVGDITTSSGITYELDSFTITYGEPIPTNPASIALMMFLMLLVFFGAMQASIEIAVITTSAVPLMFSIMGLTTLPIIYAANMLAAGLIVATVIGVVRR